MLCAPGLSDKFNIGARNVERINEILRRKRLRVKGRSTGGQSGRTLALDVATGEVAVKKVGEKESTPL